MNVMYKLLSRSMLGFALLYLLDCGGGSSSTGGGGGLGGAATLRVDISVGTTGQLFVSWPETSGASYYNLQRSNTANSGYELVQACSGTAANESTRTNFNVRVCRDKGLSAGTTYYYEVQA